MAIACQGGGSHAAFAAGVLLGLLSPQWRQRVQITALSGTSGGAMCAALAWRGLVSSGADEAAQRLLGFWHDLQARSPLDAIGNFWQVWLTRLPVTVDVSPYLAEPLAEPRLRQLLAAHLDLEQLTGDCARRARPKLFIGATDVLGGERVVFQGEQLSYDHVIASAAVPPLFRAVETEGHVCWDGLFTTNPPVREFTALEEPPDEIWVVQINPQRRQRVPRSMWEIKDRSNELSGNLSLGQELFFVDKINQLLERYEGMGGHYKHIRIRVVELDLGSLDYPSKLDRASAFIERLLELGRERAEWFFEARSQWPHEGAAPASAVLAAGGPLEPVHDRSVEASMPHPR